MAHSQGGINFSVHPNRGKENLDVMHRNAQIREGYHNMPGNREVFLPGGQHQVKKPRMGKAGWFDTRSAERRI